MDQIRQLTEGLFGRREQGSPQVRVVDVSGRFDNVVREKEKLDGKWGLVVEGLKQDRLDAVEEIREVARLTEDGDRFVALAREVNHDEVAVGQRLALGTQRYEESFAAVSLMDGVHDLMDVNWTSRRLLDLADLEDVKRRSEQEEVFKRDGALRLVANYDLENRYLDVPAGVVESAGKGGKLGMARFYLGVNMWAHGEMANLASEKVLECLEYGLSPKDIGEVNEGSDLERKIKVL